MALGLLGKIARKKEEEGLHLHVEHLDHEDGEKRAYVSDAAGHTRFVLGSDTVCTSLLSSLRMVFVATPVVALLKCFDVQKRKEVEITKQSKISETPGKGHVMHTMLDTPLVRGEREGFAEVGGGRLDMARNKGCTLAEVFLFKTLTCTRFAHSRYISFIQYMCCTVPVSCRQNARHFTQS